MNEEEQLIDMLACVPVDTWIQNVKNDNISKEFALKWAKKIKVEHGLVDFEIEMDKLFNEEKK